MSTSIGSTAGLPPSASGTSGRAWLARLTIALLLAMGVGLGGCAGESANGAALTPEQFVDVIVALREAEREVAEEDSAAALFEERKRAILERHGTTEEELRGFIANHRDELPALQAAWDTITERLKYARTEPDPWDDSVNAPPTASPDTGEAPDPPLLRRAPPPVPGGAEIH